MARFESAQDYNALAPYLLTDDLDSLVEFLINGLGAMLLRKDPGSLPGGYHCELQLEDSVLMIGAAPDIPPTSTMLHLYVDDVDASYERAMKCGGTTGEEPADTDYGARRAAVVDPGGNTWYLSTRA